MGDSKLFINNYKNNIINNNNNNKNNLVEEKVGLAEITVVDKAEIEEDPK